MTNTADAPRSMIFSGDCIDLMQTFNTGPVHMILTGPPNVTNQRVSEGRTVANDENGCWQKLAFAKRH